MSTNHTKNYNLCQWEAEDQVLRTDFNGDNAKLDAALAAQAGALDTKADVSALEALSKMVSALSGTVSGHTGSLSRKGNCQIYSTTYVGDGKYGSAYPKTLTFPGRPLFVLIARPIVAGFLAIPYGGNGVHVGQEPYSIPATWGSNYVRWYSETGAVIQHTASDITYYITALLAVD